MVVQPSTTLVFGVGDSWSFSTHGICFSLSQHSCHSSWVSTVAYSYHLTPTMHPPLSSFNYSPLPVLWHKCRCIMSLKNWLNRNQLLSTDRQTSYLQYRPVSSKLLLTTVYSGGNLQLLFNSQQNDTPTRSNGIDQSHATISCACK